MQRRMNKPQSRAQSFVQYAFLIAIAAGVLVGMRIFMLRAVQEKFRQSADVFGQGEQYQKGVTVVTNLDAPTTTLPLDYPPVRSCDYVVGNVARLKQEITDLNARADSWERSGTDTEAQISGLKAQADAWTAEANQKEARANNLRTQAVALNAQADTEQAQIDQCRINPAYDESVCGRIPELEEEISRLRSQAASMNNQATSLEGEVRQLRSQAASLNDGITRLQRQVQGLRGIAGDARRNAADKQAQIDQYKRDYPQCVNAP